MAFWTDDEPRRRVGDGDGGERQRMAYESPQMRRLRSDLAAMEQLQAESSVLQFRAFGKPAQRYLIEFRGKSLSREKGKVGLRDHHEVEVKLGASYPRSMPELRWLTPIYHPNISEIGLVCLGGYGTHWVPSLHLDELCVMLWDMARYHNYDIRSPYNREAALWAANQSAFTFPMDSRPLRDRRAAQGRIESPTPPQGEKHPELKPPIATAEPRPSWMAPEAKPASATTPTGPRDHRSDETIEICILDVEMALPPRASTPPRPPADREVIFLE